MRQPAHLAIYGLTWLLLLLSSCAKTEDSPAPDTPTSSSSQWAHQADIQHLRRLFSDRQYDQKLIQPLADKENTKIYWTPLWHKAFKRTTSQSQVYVYIPLEPKLQAAPYSVHLMGTKRFLLVKQTEGQSEFSIATYLFTEPKQSATAASVNRSFFASFSGILMLKHLATGVGTRFTYQQGIAAQRATPSRSSSSTTATPTATSSANAVVCEYFETCYWSASCRDYNGNYVVSGTMTSGQNYCPEPGQEPCSEYWGATWSQTSSERYEQCYGQEDPPPPPTDPSDGGGGGSDVSTFDANITDQSLQPCMASILTQIKNISDGQIGFIIQGFGGQIPGYNWTLQNGNLPINTYGQTIMDPANNRVLTTFDANLFASASDLSIARTIMHESVHAYLVASFYYDQTLARAAYPDLVQAFYAKKHPDMNAIQHDQMVSSFVQQIAYGLQQYGAQKGYNLSSEFYINMAWGGLEGTRAFQNLSATQQKQIRDTIITELTGKDSNGNTMPQKGSPSGC